MFTKDGTAIGSAAPGDIATGVTAMGGAATGGAATGDIASGGPSKNGACGEPEHRKMGACAEYRLNNGEF